MPEGVSFCFRSLVPQAADWLDMVLREADVKHTDRCGGEGSYWMLVHKVYCIQDLARQVHWVPPPILLSSTESVLSCSSLPPCSHITKEEFRRLMSSEMYANLQLFESRISSGRGSREFGSVLGSVMGSGSHD